ncbi:hypothetical protein, partial [Cronobacter sakazakii]
RFCQNGDRRDAGRAWRCA